MQLKAIIALLVFYTCYFGAHAQKQVTEFTRGGVLLVKLNNGVTSGFHAAAPDLYTGGAGLNPQITVSEGRLRLGVNAALAVNNKKASGLFGPMAALKLKDLKAGDYGSLGNVQLLAEANWGTNKQQMAGLGLGLELLQLIQVGITGQRDYKLNNWWFQSFIAYQFNKRKKTRPEFD